MPVISSPPLNRYRHNTRKIIDILKHEWYYYSLGETRGYKGIANIILAAFLTKNDDKISQNMTINHIAVSKLVKRKGNISCPLKEKE